MSRKIGLMFIVFRYKNYVVSLVYLQLLPIKVVENPYVFAIDKQLQCADYNKSVLVEFTCNSNIMLSWFYSDFSQQK